MLRIYIGIVSLTAVIMFVCFMPAGVDAACHRRFWWSGIDIVIAGLALGGTFDGCL